MNSPFKSFKYSAPLTTLALAAALSGCATAPEGTNTVGTLYMDTRQAVFAADDSAAPGCDSRRVVTTEVVTPPDVVVTAFPNNRVPEGPVVLPRANVVEPADRRFSRAVERWTIERCGKQARYLVTFVPSDEGGTDISVTPEG